MEPSEKIIKRAEELGGWRGQLFTRLCEIVTEADPEITPEWKWNTAAWSHGGLVCAVGAFKDSVGLNFFQGASLKDPGNLFNSGLDAKLSRFVRYSEGDAVDEPALKNLIREAVAFNASK